MASCGNEHILALPEFTVVLGGVNLACIIADHLYKHAPRTKESSVICACHYVIKIASSLGYCLDDEIKKCSEPIGYFGGNSSGYAVGGSSRGAGFDDEDMDE
nr:hypothetical protein [Tanacetum cinerariifolium]